MFLFTMLYFVDTPPANRVGDTPEVSLSRKRRYLNAIRSRPFLSKLLSLGVLCDMVLPIESIDDMCVYVRKSSRRSLRPVHRQPEMLNMYRGSEIPAAEASSITSNTSIARSDMRNSTSSSYQQDMYLRQANLSFYRCKFRFFNVVVAVAVLLTYGLAFPPLAGILALYVINSTLVLQICLRAHYTALKSVENRIRFWCAMVAEETRDTSELLYGTTRRSIKGSVALFSVLFVSFFLYDMTSGFVLPTVVVVLVYSAILFRRASVNTVSLSFTDYMSDRGSSSGRQLCSASSPSRSVSRSRSVYGGSILLGWLFNRPTDTEDTGGWPQRESTMELGRVTDTDTDTSSASVASTRRGNETSGTGTTNITSVYSTGDITVVVGDDTDVMNPMQDETDTTTNI